MMKAPLLPDTSAWIDFLRNQDSFLRRRLAANRSQTLKAQRGFIDGASSWGFTSVTSTASFSQSHSVQI